MARNPNDSVDRKAFRAEVYDRIESGNAPGLEALTNGHGGPNEMRMGFRSEKGEFIPTSKPGVFSIEGPQPQYVESKFDASHLTPDASGTNYLGMEDSSTNRRDGANLDKNFTVEKKAREIQGVAMADHYAQTLEDAGLLKPGTVANSPETKGWVNGVGNVGLDGQPLPNPSPLAKDVSQCSSGITPPSHQASKEPTKN